MSLVGGPKTGFFDGHGAIETRPRYISSSSRAPYHICGFQYRYGCALRVEQHCLVGRTRRRFSAGCVCQLDISSPVCTESLRFWQVLMPFLIVTQVGPVGIMFQAVIFRKRYSQHCGTRSFFERWFLESRTRGRPEDALWPDFSCASHSQVSSKRDHLSPTTAPSGQLLSS